jgi:hypothetical protein
LTLRMADGPVHNLPAGLEAYAGYVNFSGIGITYPGVVAAFPAARHLRITTNGAFADCADVENGAMSSWAGYAYGYCSVSRVNSLIAQFGRPRKLWTSHYDPAIGAHRCSPACWPGLATTADGTQWVDHGGWDESLLADDFFDLVPTGPGSQPPPPAPSTVGGRSMVCDMVGGGFLVARSDGSVDAFDGAGFFGSLPGLRVKPGAPVVGIAGTATGKGYWLVDAGGGIYCFGDAKYYGPLPKYLQQWNLGLGRGIPIVGLARGTARNVAYALVGDNGGPAADPYRITLDGQYNR